MDAAEKQRQEITPEENLAGPEEREHQRPSSVKVNPVPLEEVPGEPESNPEEAGETATPEISLAPVRHNPWPDRTTRKPERYRDGVCHSMELSENSLEVEQDNSKTVLTDATKAFLLKHSFSLDDVRALEKMDNEGNTSLQDLLTSVTTSLKETEEALGTPEPVGVAAPKRDQEWEEATGEASTSCSGEAVS